MNWHVFAMVIAGCGGLLVVIFWGAFVVAATGYVEERHGYGWSLLTMFGLLTITIATIAGVIA